MNYNSFETIFEHKCNANKAKNNFHPNVVNQNKYTTLESPPPYNKVCISKTHLSQPYK